MQVPQEVFQLSENDDSVKWWEVSGFRLLHRKRQSKIVIENLARVLDAVGKHAL